MFPRPLTLAHDTPIAVIAVRVNEFARDVITALARRPRIVLRSFTFVGADTDVDVSTDLRAPPAGAWLARVAVKATPQTAITAALHLDGMWSGPAIRVRGIAGLTSGTEYDVTIAMVET